MLWRSGWTSHVRLVSTVASLARSHAWRLFWLVALPADGVNMPRKGGKIVRCSAQKRLSAMHFGLSFIALCGLRAAKPDLNDVLPVNLLDGCGPASVLPTIR